MKKFILTIGRQYLSGGRYIGEKLARELNVPFYDKKIINLASKESGICDEFFEKADECPSNSILNALASTFSSTGLTFHPNEYLSNESLFSIQSEIIRKLADKGSCVIVGRCADYLLRENKDLIRIFISADMKDRISTIMKRNSVDEHRAIEILKKADKTRSGYYNYYTDKEWGASSSYDFCINSSKCGEEGTIKIIKELINLKK